MKNNKWNIHLIMIGIILAVVFLAGIRLFIWNKGVESDYNLEETTKNTDFDAEPLDVSFILTPDKLEGHPDDGEDIILFLGNNAITDGRDFEENGRIPELIEAQTTAKTLNGGVPESLIACDSKVYIDTCPWDAFRLYHVSNALCTGDFSLQERALASDNLTEDQKALYSECLKRLLTFDLKTVDTLVIFYDARDMLNYRPVMEDTGHDIATVCGSLASAIELFQEKYPYIRIVIMSPWHTYAVNESGFYESLNYIDYGHGTLPDYLYSIGDVAMMHDVSLIDNYYGTVTELTEMEYLEDNIKLNNKGREFMANRLINFLKLKPADEP
ncbi:MAG: hypothetical protein IJU50_04175 [Lachnospiraceae bacterium]|nr:hypothetical protein [Lachnospiraceae bacterium]